MLSATKLALYIVTLLQGRRLSNPEDSVASKASQPVKQSGQSALQPGTPVLIPAVVTPVIERFLQASSTIFSCTGQHMVLTPIIWRLTSWMYYGLLPYPLSLCLHHLGSMLFATRLPSTCPRHVSYVFLGSILINIGQNFNVDYIKCMCSISCVQVECSS